MDRGVRYKQSWWDVTFTYGGHLTWNAFYEFCEHFLTPEENVEDATEEEPYYILITQILESLHKRVVEHQIRVSAERFRLSVTGLSKMMVPELKD